MISCMPSSGNDGSDRVPESIQHPEPGFAKGADRGSALTEESHHFCIGF